MIFDVRSVKILLLVLVCLYHVYYLIYLCLKMPVRTTQCQLKKATSGIFLRSYRMCCRRGKIGKIRTEIRNSELGSILFTEAHKSVALCYTQWLMWLNKKPEAISFSSWLKQGWPWHRMWREWVKSFQKNSWSSEEQTNKTTQKNKPNQFKNRRILEKKCLITMPASFEMLFEGFRLSDSFKMSFIHHPSRQSLLVMSTKHFSTRLVLPAGRQYGISTRDCTGTWKDFFSAILTCWVALEKLLLSKP